MGNWGSKDGERGIVKDEEKGGESRMGKRGRVKDGDGVGKWEEG